jgi:hypothetical protein
VIALHTKAGISLHSPGVTIVVSRGELVQSEVLYRVTVIPDDKATSLSDVTWCKIFPLASNSALVFWQFEVPPGTMWSRKSIPPSEAKEV